MNESTHQPIRVLLLDHHTLVREGLRYILGQQARFLVVGEAGAGKQALALARDLQPDITLLELNLDGDLYAEIISDLLVAADETRIILVTGITDASILNLAVKLGAMGVVHKAEASQVLLKAIEKVYLGEVWIDRVMMASVLASLSRGRQNNDTHPEAARIASLSEREREVITLIGQGMKNKEIAHCLTISETTVRHHLSSIYNKLDVSDRLELTIYAFRYGLASLPE
jgi:two-component system nitrate/nitrite response regulator NarL